MRKRPTHFTLVEVLISLVLIVIALPLLITPFFYARLEREETLKKMKMHKSSKEMLGELLISLRKGELPLQEKSFNEERFGFLIQYDLKKIEEKEKKEGLRVELWQITLSLGEKQKKEKEVHPQVTSFDFVALYTPEAIDVKK